MQQVVISIENGLIDSRVIAWLALFSKWHQWHWNNTYVTTALRGNKREC
jgi:hypothetical protein